jgi:hypothetical protein
MTRASCRYCGINKALIGGYDGFGVRRRRHERRCKARLDKAAAEKAARLLSEEYFDTLSFCEAGSTPSTSSTEASRSFRDEEKIPKRLAQSCSRRLRKAPSNVELGAFYSASSVCPAMMHEETNLTGRWVMTDVRTKKTFQYDWYHTPGSPFFQGQQLGGGKVSQGCLDGDTVSWRSAKGKKCTAKISMDDRLVQGEYFCPSGRKVGDFSGEKQAPTWRLIAHATEAARISRAAKTVLKAPILAGSHFMSSATMWFQKRRATPKSTSKATLMLTTPSAPAVSTEAKVVADISPSLSAEVVQLVRSFHVTQALALAEDNGLLDAMLSNNDPIEIHWLQQLAPKFALVDMSLPPAPVDGPFGGPWSGPAEWSTDRAHMSLWYRWSGPSTVSTVSELKVPGTVAQCLALVREADLLYKWAPFVYGPNAVSGDCHETLPATVGTLRAKVPLSPIGVSLLVQRAFLDFLGSESAKGIMAIDWTPSCGVVASGECNGMKFPQERYNTPVDLATTFIQDIGQGRCRIVLKGSNDLKVNKRFVPDVVLRKFMKLNAQVLGQGIATALEDGDSSYLQRIEADPQGFYGLVAKRLADTNYGPQLDETNERS